MLAIGTHEQQWFVFTLTYSVWCFAQILWHFMRGVNDSVRMVVMESFSQLVIFDSLS
jgi:hypothetical protein